MNPAIRSIRAFVRRTTKYLRLGLGGRGHFRAPAKALIVMAWWKRSPPRSIFPTLPGRSSFSGAKDPAETVLSQGFAVDAIRLVSQRTDRFEESVDHDVVFQRHT